MIIDEQQTKQELKALITYWTAKQGSYQPTSLGTVDKSFKQINEQKAYANVQYYAKLLSWLEQGQHLKQETRVKVHQAWLRAAKRD